MSFHPPTSDSHQFAHRANRSTEDGVATALHAALTHLEQQGIYARLLFIDLSSAFNTILPHRLVSKLSDIGIPHCTCLWVKDFFTERTERVRVGLHTLYTHDCIPIHHSNTFVKLSDDTTVVELISRGDESDYRDEVERLWCKVNNLLLNTSKTKELIVDFKRKKTDIQPLLIGRTRVERVSNFRFLGVNIIQDLTWSVHTS